MTDDQDLSYDDMPPYDELPYTEVGCDLAPATEGILPDPHVMAAATRSAPYGTSAMYRIYDLVTVKGMRRSGIVGDAAHTYGYHCARAVLPRSDYSVQAPADQRGDSWLCSGIDLSFGPAEMKLVTRRIMDSMRDKSDRRSDCIREVFGTLDGRHVTGWNALADANRGVGYTSSDSSHLWHVHISIFRGYASDTAVMEGVAAIINGEGVVDDMPTAKEFADEFNKSVVPNIAKAVAAELLKVDGIVTAGVTEKDPKNKFWAPKTFVTLAFNKLDSVEKSLARLESTVEDAVKTLTASRTNK